LADSNGNPEYILIAFLPPLGMLGSGIVASFSEDIENKREI
jgi:hypothetical protein